GPARSIYGIVAIDEGQTRLLRETVSLVFEAALGWSRGAQGVGSPRVGGIPRRTQVLPLLGRAWRSARRHRQSQAQRTPLASRRGRTGVSLHERRSTSEGLFEVGQKGGFRAMKLKRVRIALEPLSRTQARWKRALGGKAVSDSKRTLITVASWEVLGKVLSPRRLELLARIPVLKPK